MRELLWLRWKQFQDTAVYWMRALGYPSDASAATRYGYIAYIIGFLLFWVAAMWAYSYDQARLIGEALGSEAAGTLLRGFPWAVLAVQAVVASGALRSTPLKLTFADMAYVAGSPMPRAAVVVVNFLRQAVLRYVIAGVVTAFFFVIVVEAIREGEGVAAYFRLLLVMLPLVVITWAAAWILGVLRLVLHWRWSYLWVLPFVFAAVTIALPLVGLWPGYMVAAYVFGEAPTWTLLFLFGLALVSVAVLVRVSQRINMVQAIDESQLYARMAALGVVAMRQPRLVAQMRFQTSYAGRKPVLNLPKAQGFWSPATRAGLMYLRRPMLLLTTMLWGFALTYLGLVIVVNSSPAPLWILWLLLIGLVPPAGLLHVFQTDVESPFLRQFIQLDGMAILLADTLMPLVGLIGGGAVAVLLWGLDVQAAVMAVLFVGFLGVLITLCGAYALTRPRTLEARLLAVSMSILPVMVAGENLGQPFLALGLAGAGILIVSGLISVEV